jgi:hypothetical protein
MSVSSILNLLHELNKFSNELRQILYSIHHISKIKIVESEKSHFPLNANIKRVFALCLYNANDVTSKYMHSRAIPLLWSRKIGTGV